MTTPHETPRTYAFAPQDSVDLHTAAASLIQAEWVLLDFDDTFVQHDPEAQYWLALHTLASSHGGKDQFDPADFELHYLNGPEHPQTLTYLEEVRDICRQHCGQPNRFEMVAEAFRQPNNGSLLKAAIKTLPSYDSSGRFWQARAQLLAESEVAPTFGKQIMPGMDSLVRRLSTLGKNMGIISNSRDDMVLPAMEALFPQQSQIFRLILTLGCTETPLKPDPAAFDLVQRRQGKITANETVYVGNAYEDAAFAAAIGSAAIILGRPFDTPQPTPFVSDVRQLSQVVRRHTEAAPLARLARRGPQETLQASDSPTLPTTPSKINTMVIEGLQQLWNRHLDQTVEAITSNLWGDEQPSLRTIENFCNRFGPIMGEMRVDTLGSHPVISAYYTSDRLDTSGKDDAISLRSSSYFAAVDPRFKNSAARTAFIKHELLAALEAAAQTEAAELSPTDLLPYLGILDNAKQQALTLFHAFIHQERRQGTPHDSTYLAQRQSLLNLATLTTRAFYEACLGYRPSLPLDRSAIKTSLMEATPYLEAAPDRGFKLQELDHPLRILLTSYGLSQESADTVIGFPSGGTQVAIATALALEKRHLQAAGCIQVLCVPLSQHSGTLKEGEQPLSDINLARSIALYREAIVGKRLLLVDDNASTGSTLRRCAEAVRTLAPQDVRGGVCEIDPRRLLLRARMAANGATVPDSINLHHPMFAHASGVVPVTISDRQLRKRYAQQVINQRNNT